MEITRGSATRVLERAKAPNKDGKEEDKWRETSTPSARTWRWRSGRHSSRADWRTRRVDVAALPSGAKPEVTLALTFDEGKQERVSFFRTGDEAYATRDGITAKIPVTLLDSITKAIDEIR